MHEVHSDLNNVPVFRDTNELKKKAKGLKKDYDRLHRLSTNQVGYLILSGRMVTHWQPEFL